MGKGAEPCEILVLSDPLARERDATGLSVWMSAISTDAGVTQCEVA